MSPRVTPPISSLRSPRRALILSLLVLLLLGTALLLVAPPSEAALCPGATHCWTGGGIDSNWGTAANWEGLSAPTGSGTEVIEFPDVAAQKTNVNNLSNLVVSSIRLVGSGYSISGNQVTVNSGITSSNSAGSNTLSLPIALGAAQSFTVSNSGATLTHSGVLGGSAASTLTKAGAGRLTLSGNNTYTAPTTVSAGFLRVASTNGLGSSVNGTTVESGATLEVDGGISISEPLNIAGGGVGGAGALNNVSGTNAVSSQVAMAGTIESPGSTSVGSSAGSLIVDGVVSGESTLTKVGVGTVALAASNTYTRATTVSAGTLNIRDSSALADAAAGTTVASSTRLEFQGNLVVAEPLDVAGTLASVSGTSTASGPVTLSSTIEVAAGSSFAISGAIDGAGGLTKKGDGTLTLSGGNSNSYAGATVVEDGTLELSKIGGAVAVPGAVTVGDDDGSDALVLLASAQIATTSDVTIKSSGLLDLNGFSNTISSLTMTAGAVTTGAGTLTLGGNVTTNAADTPASIAGNLSLGSSTRTFTVADGAADPDLSVAASVSGSGGLTKAGAGRLTLAGASSYGGATSVSAGALTVTGNTALGATGSGTTVSSGAALEVAGDITSAEPLTLNGTGISSTGALRSLSGTNAFTGTVALVSASSVGVDVDNLTLSGLVSGSGGLTKVADGTLQLSAANSYDGTTSVTEGTLLISHGSALGVTGGSTTVSSGAALAVQGSITSAEPLTLNGSGVEGAGALRSLSGANTFSGTVSLNPSTVVVAVDADTLTLSGVVSDTGAGSGITKIGPGTLRLGGSANNLYSGATIVNEGTLELAKTGGTIAVPGALTVGDGVGGDASDVVLLLGSGQIATTSDVTIKSSGLFDLSGFSNTVSSLTMTAGAVTTGAGTLTLGGNVTNNAADTPASISGKLSLGSSTRTFTVADGAANPDLSVAALVSGSGGLTKAGAGRLTLSGANTYSGATSVSAGSLTAANDAALGATGSGTTVSSGAALEVTGNITSGEPLTLNGTGIGSTGALRSLSGTNAFTATVALASASSVGVDADTLTLSGVVSGAFALTKVGAGTLILSADNTYTGTTTASAGTLLINGSQPASAVSLAGGTLGGTGTTGDVTSASQGGRVSPGASPGILAVGDVSFNSATTFRVELNGAAAGTGYDRLNVTGTVSLGNATLSAARGFQPSVGDTFTIITNDAADAVTGTFAGLAQGASFSVTTTTFSISYTGGDGNDVVLSVTSIDNGYWILESNGGVHARGNAGFFGSAFGVVPSGATDMDRTSSANGYWIVEINGGVHARGDAGFFGAAFGVAPSGASGISGHPNDCGYWIVESNGGVHARGCAGFLGSAFGSTTSPAVGIASTPTGNGYWIFESNGGVHARGDAGFFGAVFGVVPSGATRGDNTSTGGGYWIVENNGGVHARGDAGFFGSAFGVAPSGAKGISGTPDNLGYWIFESNGGVHARGNAGFFGSVFGIAASPVVDVEGRGS